MRLILKIRLGFCLRDLTGREEDANSVAVLAEDGEVYLFLVPVDPILGLASTYVLKKANDPDFRLKIWEEDEGKVMKIAHHHDKAEQQHVFTFTYRTLTLNKNERLMIFDMLI